VAMTRARDFLYVLWPLRYYHKSSGLSDNHSYAQCCRFLNREVISTMECLTPPEQENQMEIPTPDVIRGSILDRINDMWR